MFTGTSHTLKDLSLKKVKDKIGAKINPRIISSLSILGEE